MKRISIAVCVLLAYGLGANAQGLVGKLKQKAKQVSENALEKKVDEKVGIPSDSGNGNSGNDNSGSSESTTYGTSSTPTNKGGGGLVVAPPDVNKNISDAETAFNASNYSQAKYAVQQAMLGVELEIGHQVLESFPKTVDGLPVKEDADQVTSTGWGWAGLTIHREYLQDDKDLQVTVANNAAYMTAVNMYLSNPGYAQSGGEQNWKPITIQDNRGIIEYSDSEGYKISVPVGQTSLIIWQGINFSSEQEITDAANAFDVAGIKEKLGEK